MFPINEELIPEKLHPLDVHETFNWVFWLLMFVNLIIFALVRTVNGGYFKSLFSTAFFNRQLVQNAAEHLRLFGAGSMLMNLAYLNCLALSLSQISFGLVNANTFLILFTVLVTTTVKLLLMQFIAFTAKSSDGIAEHTLNHFVYFQMAAVVLTPVFIFTFFVPSAYQALVGASIAGILAVFILWREIQSLMRTLRYRMNGLYIILYLCTLELLPLVLLIKVFVVQ